MRTAVKTARLTMVGSALVLMVSGMIMWGGKGDQIGLVHVGLGIVLALSLWTIAAFATRAGVSRSVVGLAVIWSLAAIALGVAQGSLLTGTDHWEAQALHLVTAMGMVAWGQGLILLMRRVRARGKRSATGALAVDPTCCAAHAVSAAGEPWRQRRPRF